MLAHVIQMIYICREQLKITIMKATFEIQNLVNYKGEVLVDKDGIAKIYTSIRVAQKTADKVGGRVVRNVKRFIVVR